MEKRKSLKEIREKMNEITKTPPTQEEIKKLGEFFKQIEEKSPLMTPFPGDEKEEFK